MFEVGEQAIDWPVDLLSQALMIHHVAVRIPVAGGTGVNQFNKPNPALGQAPGCEALPAEAVGLAGVQSVQ